jgi:archaellum component FlaF (FlaF/FlaG flagellin family)
MIVSIAGTYLFAYSTNYIQTQNDQYLTNNELELGQTQERFTVSSVWWRGTDNFLNITVYNFGQNDIEVSDVYVNGIRVSSYSHGRDTLILTEKLLQVGFTSPVAIISGSEYKITVVSSRGVTEIIYWSA